MRLAPAPSRSADPRLRGALLMPACALAVHQARYYLAFGGHAPSRLAHDGHAYLASVQPLALMAVALAGGAFAGSVARVWRGAAFEMQSRPRGGLRVWAVCSLMLLALYCAQELCEGALFAAHPAGIAGVLGHGGWIAIPFAIAIGGGLAAVLRVSEAVLRLAAARGPHRRRSVARAQAPRRSAAPRLDWRLEPSSGVSAGRSPPGGLALSAQ
ncbi:MAG: hypothetical protein JO153_11175 [Solirubrobacterales bacterium]|nr:hypothetical protein [Solirubrobacterales bacterium]